MPLFAFDDAFSMFDVTPVENLFITEYLPGAKGDYVKVYLYGLMQAYHPGGEQELAGAAHQLGLTEDEVLAAYRYWERRGLCRRVSDKPPAFQYVNLKQMMMTQQQPPRDPGYEEFAEALYAAFGEKRRLHGGETTLAYEWVEEMGLPPEVVLMMVHHLIETRGMQFSFQAAQKLAVKLAEEKVHSVEDAELYLARDKKVRENTKKLLRRLGKRRNPSEDELDLCQKWMTQWGYDLPAMEAACAETTKGEPTFAYLDGILRGLRERSGGGRNAAAQLKLEREQAAPLKALLAVMGAKGLGVNEGTLAAYAQLRALAADEVILIAGRECARAGGGLEEVLRTLSIWKKQGLTQPADIQAFLETLHSQNAFVAGLYSLWGRPGKPTPGDRTLLTKWTEEWGFTLETIQAVAPYAQEAARPMAYLDGMLKDSRAKGLMDALAIQAARESFQRERPKAPQPPVKTVTQQQYTQRPHREDDLSAELDKYMKEFNP